VWIAHNKSTPRSYPTDLYLHILHIYNVDRCRVYTQFHSILILLVDVSLLCLCNFPSSGFITGFSPISRSVHSLSLWIRTFIFSLTRLRVIFLPSALCADFSMFYLTHLWAVSVIIPVYESPSPLDVHKLIISLSLVAALAIPILVPFELLFNIVTLGFTCHLSYLHTYIQPNDADCRRVTFTQNLKNCFCTDVRYPTTSSTGLHTIT
jgi:hypothetical protein